MRPPPSTSRRPTHRLARPFLAVAVACVGACSGGHPHPAGVAAAPTILAAAGGNVVVVKFREGSRVRLRAGAFTADATGRTTEERRRLRRAGFDEARVGPALQELDRLLRADAHLRAERVFSRAEADLEREQREGETRSGQELADLTLYVRLHAGPRSPAALDQLVARLRALQIVETAYVEPPALPAGPTPSYEDQQVYLNNAASNGIDARYAWSFPGGRGEGVRIGDVEGGWRLTHEELADRPWAFQHGASNQDWIEHGTSVLGILAGVSNGFGVTGIVPNASIGVSSLFASDTDMVQRIADAINQAAASLGAGDILLIEVHREDRHYAGPVCTCPTEVECRTLGWLPVEYWQAEYDAIRAATAAGIIVVEAGGNGSANLDDSYYAGCADGMTIGGCFDRSVRDSGAILVGAGSRADRAPMCSTNYGSRVDVQGWGEQVMTTGWSYPYVAGAVNFDPGAGDPNRRYTSAFSGTSSASAIVVGAAAALQGIRIASGRPRLDPAAMRDALRLTGVAQKPGTRPIGPLVSLRNALSPTAFFVASCADRSCTFDASGSANGISYSWSFGDASSPASDVVVHHTFPQNQSYVVTLTVTGASGTDATLKKYIGITPTQAVTPTKFYARRTPCRLLDTRTTGGPIAGGTSRDIQVAGGCGIPTWATAAALNLAATGGTGLGYVMLLPKGLPATLTGSSVLNYSTGQTVANGTVARLGTGGALTATAGVSGTNLIVDVVGFFGSGSRPSKQLFVGPLGFAPLTPCRVADTRTNNGTPTVFPWPYGPPSLPGGSPRSMTLTGHCGVPADATAVFQNLTVTNTQGPGHILAFAQDTAAPPTSVLNYAAGDTRGNGAFVGLSPSGGSTYVAAVSQTDLVIDTFGYFRATAGLASYVALVPCRVMDTRAAGPSLASRTRRTLQVQQQCGVPLGAKSAVLNVTATHIASSGDVTMFPSSLSSTPLVSTLHIEPGGDRSGWTAVPLAASLDDVAIWTYTTGAPVDLVVDVVGYFQ